MKDIGVYYGGEKEEVTALPEPATEAAQAENAVAGRWGSYAEDVSVTDTGYAEVDNVVVAGLAAGGMINTIRTLRRQ